MALTRTGPEFVMDIRIAADLKSDSDKARFPDPMLLKHVMVAINKFWRLGNEGPQGEIGFNRSTLTLTPGTATYAFTAFSPSLATMMQLVLMEMTADGRKGWLTHYEHFQHAALSDPQNTLNGIPLGFRIIESSIEFQPTPGGSYSIVVTWIPLPTQIGSAPASWDTVNGLLDEWVPAYGVREVALRNKDWALHDRMNARLLQLEADVRAEFRKRNMSGPPRVTDVAYQDRFGRYRRWP